MSPRPRFGSVEEYFNSVDPASREILERIRAVILEVVPDAKELISYQMPAFKRSRIFIFYAAFQKHIGVYPPLQADADLVAELAPYRGEKGNLKFSLDQPMPYDLIARVAKALAEQASAPGRADD